MKNINIKVSVGEYKVGHRGSRDWVVIKNGEVVSDGHSAISPALTMARRLYDEDKNPCTIPWVEV